MYLVKGGDQLLYLRSVIRADLLFCLSFCMVACLKNPEPPKLTSEITSFSSIEISVRTSIVSDGGTDIFQKGICISNHKNPTLADSKSNDGAGNEDYESKIIGFSETVYIRSYAVNGAGAGYGNELSVSYAEVVISEFGDITGTSAFFRANVNSDSQILSRGICWSTSSVPTIDDNRTEKGTGPGIFECTITGLIPGTTYYVRAYASNASGIFYSGEFSLTTKDFPTLTTKEIKNASTFIPVSGGDIINNGGAVILHAGVCWSTDPSPTIDNPKTDDYVPYTSFNSDLSGLQPGTTYYIRAFATTLVGTGYGNERVITMPAAAVYDIDNNPYSSVTIGTQVWTVENLRTTRYENGDAITNVTDQAEWRNLTSGAWTYYAGDPQFENPYGLLYNWFAVSDPRNICPVGWHVPGDEEWGILTDFLGGDSVAGGKLKEEGSVHWFTPNPGATNSSGFTALPGGSQSAEFSQHLIGNNGIFWSDTPYDNAQAYGYSLTDYEVKIRRFTYLNQFGFSVRCLKDN